MGNYLFSLLVLEWCCNSFEIKKNNFILRMDLTIIHFITPLGRTEKNLYLLILIILHMLRMVLIGCHNHSFSLIGWHILTHTLMLSSYWLNFINLSLTAHEYTCCIHNFCQFERGVMSHISFIISVIGQGAGKML